MRPAPPPVLSGHVRFSSRIPSSSADVAPSPNFDERKDGRPPDMILLHYTGHADRRGRAAAPHIAAQSKVSAHYVVFEDGRIVQCVPEERRAWHAGESSWAGETDINSRSIGIEIVNPGHEFGYHGFSAPPDCGGDLAVQIDHHPARADQRRPHPRAFRRRASRKQDPGEKFPWGLLSESGVGHWVRAAPLDLEGIGLKPGDRGDAVTRLAAYVALLWLWAGGNERPMTMRRARW